MKFLKTHYGRAIPVITSDEVKIPNPAGLGMSGTTTSAATGILVDSSKVFTTNLLGAIAVNDTTNEIANITGFTNSTTLVVDNNIFSLGDSYSIYNSVNNEGCSLYIPAQEARNLKVLTVGGDVISFTGCGDLNSHTILPVSVLKVFRTGTSITDLIAIW
jgi:hypothetical protein